jgi:hypothetical protein
MDFQHEIATLIASGLRFTIELTGRQVDVAVGDYLDHAVATASVPSLEHAINWLKTLSR